MSKKYLDDIDYLIIRNLIESPKLQQAQLAQSFGLSPGAISGRLKKLRNRGILCGYRFDFQKIKSHRIYRMYFKLATGSHQQVDKAVSYLSKFDFVLAVREIEGDIFDLVVDYVIFPDDDRPDATGANVSDVVFKAQILRDIPVKCKDTFRTREFEPVFIRKEYLDLLSSP